MNIKDIRTRKGLTQAEVASALGVSSVVYSRYETGSRQPSIDILIQPADIFGVRLTTCWEGRTSRTLHCLNMNSAC